jgi:hypothetical protein
MEIIILFGIMFNIMLLGFGLGAAFAFGKSNLWMNDNLQNYCNASCFSCNFQQKIVNYGGLNDWKPNEEIKIQWKNNS